MAPDSLSWQPANSSCRVLLDKVQILPLHAGFRMFMPGVLLFLLLQADTVRCSWESAHTGTSPYCPVHTQHATDCTRAALLLWEMQVLRQSALNKPQHCMLASLLESLPSILRAENPACKSHGQ